MKYVLLLPALFFFGYGGIATSNGGSSDNSGSGISNIETISFSSEEDLKNQLRSLLTEKLDLKENQQFQWTMTTSCAGNARETKEERYLEDAATSRAKAEGGEQPATDTASMGGYKPSIVTGRGHKATIPKGQSTTTPAKTKLGCIPSDVPTIKEKSLVNRSRQFQFCNPLAGNWCSTTVMKIRNISCDGINCTKALSNYSKICIGAQTCDITSLTGSKCRNSSDLPSWVVKFECTDICDLIYEGRCFWMENSILGLDYNMAAYYCSVLLASGYPANIYTRAQYERFMVHRWPVKGNGQVWIGMTWNATDGTVYTTTCEKVNYTANWSWSTPTATRMSMQVDTSGGSLRMHASEESEKKYGVICEAKLIN